MEYLKRYRPALAAFLLMMSMSLTTTALSFFVEPVCAGLGLSRGGFSATYSLLTAAGTLASPFLGRSIQRRGVRPLVAVSAIWVAAGLSVFSFSQSLWTFYLAAVLTGIFGTACVSLSAGVIVQTRYQGAAAARLTGVVMSGSGAGGMVVSTVLPGLIENYGWREGYRVTALAWLFLGMTAVLLLGREPEYPHEAKQAEEAAASQRNRHSQLLLLSAIIFLLSAASGVQQHIPAVLNHFGTDRVSALMLLFTASLTLGKILQGMAYGKIGPCRGGTVVIGLYAAGFLLLRAGVIVPGLLLLAVGMGSVTTLMPIVSRTVLGGRDYAAIWSILSAVSNLGAMLATPLFGLAFDVSGSYTGSLSAAAVLLIPALAGLISVFRK